MNEQQRHAFELIDRLNITEFFAFMEEKVGANPSLTHLQQTFIMGNLPPNYYEQLRLLAKQLLADKKNIIPEKVEVYQKREEILISIVVIFLLVLLMIIVIILSIPNKQVKENLYSVTRDTTKNKSNKPSIFDTKPEQVGISKSKKEATFRVHYLTNNYRWKYASETLLQTGEYLKDVLVPNLPDYPDFETALGFIAVGMASQEQRNRGEEESRAEARADQIAETLSTKIGKRELYKLYLGKYKKLEPLLTEEETGKQRRVMIISIIRKDKNMSIQEIEEALKDAYKSNLNFVEYKLYTKFELKDAIGSSVIL